MMSTSLEWSFQASTSKLSFATSACVTAKLYLALLRQPTAEKVLTGSAEFSQPTTIYVFTGQGSQEPAMGMDLYNSSPAAHAVWEGADAHLFAIYGFFIVKIIKDEPKAKSINFGGSQGLSARDTSWT